MNPQPKQKRHSDPAYLAHLRTLPCAVCGAYPPCEAAHVRLLSGGGALKPHDYHALPYCDQCHGLEHGMNGGIVTLWNTRSREAARGSVFDRDSLREHLRERCEQYYFEYMNGFVP